MFERLRFRLFAERMNQHRRTSLKYWAGFALATLCLGMSASTSRAQGCVVAHGSGIPETVETGDAEQPWDLSVSYRWFQSDRHFVGITEQKQRQASGDQVINRSNFTDLTLERAISPRYDLSVTIPYVSHDRSQVVKNSSGVILDRFHTQAVGLADISVIGNAWVFNPVNARGNIQVGLGLSLPTGKDNVSDTFETFDKASGKIVAVQHPVDQSIQPGSGGYGIILSLYGYRELGAGFTGFLSGSYTITPQDTNGTVTSNGLLSIPDTYLGRIGFEYTHPELHGLTLSLGWRVEGVSVFDVVGHSNGFRRPGYSSDIEPGIIYSYKGWTARFYIPYAVQRDRLQNTGDKKKSRTTGVYSQGDAAFADYEIISSVSYRF